MTKDERCSILLEAKERPDGELYALETLGMTDEESRRRQNIRLLSDEGYLEKLSNQVYRLTAKGDAAAEECMSKLAAIKRLWKTHGPRAIWIALKSLGITFLAWLGLG